MKNFIRWFFLSLVVGGLCGSASALFLVTLDKVTFFRDSHSWIIISLPVAGFIVGWIYYRFGQSVETGNNLIIDEIHDPKNVIPLKMTPLIFISTLSTHLFGGSAGREGTAVQMAGSLVDQITHIIKLSPQNRKVLIMAGMSAGFGSVFGTPLAGAVFGLEVITLGNLRYEAIFPCFLSSIIAYQVTLAWGIHHSIYTIPSIPDINLLNLGYAFLAGIIFGVTGRFFATASHQVGAFFKKAISYPPLRPCIGGILVLLGIWILNSTRYIGLGLPVIQEAFTGHVSPWDFLGKLAFTVITLSSGFKGGEVTPLFFIGATLGNALAFIFHLPSALLAALGFVAVFAGAANTPLTCTLLAMELFGSSIGLYAAVACVLSYMFSGHAGIYGSQKIGVHKHPQN